MCVIILNDMNKLLFFLLILSCRLCTGIPQTWATGQIGEIILIDGQKYQMLASPIEYDYKLSSTLNKYLPQELVSTDCWRGYIGEWEIKDSILYLNRISDYHNGKTINFRRTFNSYKIKGRIKASWVSKEIRVAQGTMVKYYHEGFHRYFEQETVYTIKKGKVVNQYIYHNTLKKASQKQRETEKQIASRFNFQKFPELKNANVYVGINVRPTAEGQFDSLYLFSFQVKTPFANTYIRDKKHPYVQELIRQLKQVPDWETAIVKGEIHPTDTWYFKLR